jgi:hypothetical protein
MSSRDADGAERSTAPIPVRQGTACDSRGGTTSIDRKPATGEPATTVGTVGGRTKDPWRRSQFKMNALSARELAFHEAMVDVYLRAKREANYNATYFLGMLSDIGGYETARYLLHTKEPSIGYEALSDRGRLDLTVEAVVLLPEWSDLFDDRDREIARRRLTDYAFDVDGYLARLVRVAE